MGEIKKGTQGKITATGPLKDAKCVVLETLKDGRLCVEILSGELNGTETNVAPEQFVAE